jgi:hypothetical protein
MMKPSTRRSQQGITLITALVFLLVFLLLTATALRGTVSNVQAISNAQWRAEGQSATEDALVRIITDPSDTWDTDPLALASTLQKTPLEVDINGDGVQDIQVQIPTGNNVVKLEGKELKGPTLVRYRSVPSSSLKPDDDQDKNCYKSSSQDLTGAGYVDGSGATAMTDATSICSDSEWVIPLQATDKVNGTTVVVLQGVSKRVISSSITNATGS